MALDTTLIRRVVLLGALAVRIAAAQNPSPALLVVNAGLGTERTHGSDHSLVIVDPLTNKAVGRVPISGHPHEVAASDDGKLAFVTDTSWGRDPDQVADDSISVIDLAARKELRHVGIGLGSRPHGLAFAGGKLYFTAEGFKVIGRYDPKSDQVDLLIGTGQDRSHTLGINKELNKIFTANTDSYTAVVIDPWAPFANYKDVHGEPKPLWKVSVIPSGGAPEGTAMSPDGKEIWILNRADDSIAIIDAATNKVKETVALKAKDPMRMAFTPDGKRVVLCTATTGEILILDAVTRNEIKRLKNVGIALHHVLIAPDGSRAYVSAKGNHEDATPNDVAIIDLKTLEVIGFISTGDRPEGLAWSITK